MGGILSFGISIFVPFIAPYLSSLGFKNSTISYMGSFGAIGIVAISPVMGTASDRIGRRKVIIMGLLLEIMSMLLLINFARSIILATTAMVLQITAVFVIALTLLSYVEDNMDKKTRGFFTGINESIYSIGGLIGPLVGAFLVSFLPINQVFKYSIFVDLVLIALSFFLDEGDSLYKKPKIGDFNFLREIKEFWSNKNLKGMGILGIFMHFATPGLFIFLPLFIIQDLKAPLKYVGIMATMATVFSVFQFIHGWLCDKKGSEKFIILGASITATSMFLIYFVHSISALVLIILIYSFGASMWNTSAWCYMSTIGEKMKKEGQTTGSYAAFARTGAFASFLISGALVSVIEIRGLFLIYGTLKVMAIIVSTKYIFFDERKPVRSPLFETQNAN